LRSAITLAKRVDGIEFAQKSGDVAYKLVTPVRGQSATFGQQCEHLLARSNAHRTGRCEGANAVARGHTRRIFGGEIEWFIKSRAG